GVMLLKNGKTLHKTIAATTRPRPVWLLMSTVGSHWTSMAKQLMDIPAFRTSITECYEILKKFDFDLMEVLNSDNSNTLSTALSSVLAVNAITLSLIDVIKILGIEPDGFLGYSLGEFGCVYFANG